MWDIRKTVSNLDNISSSQPTHLSVHHTLTATRSMAMDGTKLAGKFWFVTNNLPDILKY